MNNAIFLILVLSDARATRRLEKITQILGKVAKTVAKPSIAKISTIKTQFESPKQLHKNTFET
jgi:hypothetical protein